MALKFNCKNCGNEMIVQFLKVGETAKCRSCGAENIVPDTAIETSQKLDYRVQNEVKSQNLDKDESLPLPKNLGFNWGAFFLTPLWLLFHGEVGIGIGLIVLGLVLNLGRAPWWFDLPITLSIAIYFGIKGNEIAWKHKKYSSVEELKEKQRPWRSAGIAVAVVIFSLLILFLLAILLASR